MGLQDFTIYDVINRNAMCFRHHPAWFEASDGRSLSFGELKNTVDCLSTGLQLVGLKKGDRIGVLGKNSLEYFVLIGAASALGAIVLALNWRLSSDEIEYNIKDCEPRVLFADQEFQGMVEEMEGKFSFLEKYYNLRADKGCFSAFASLLDSSGDFTPTDEVTIDDGLLIIHTAAVTGRPKGVVLTNGNLVFNVINLSQSLSLTPEDVHLNVAPLFHVGGIQFAWMAFQVGCLNINVDKFDAEQTLQVIEDKKVSFLLEFPPMLASLLDEQEKTGADISSLKTLIGVERGTESVERYQKKVTGGKFYPIYGQTEVMSGITACPFDEAPGSIGRPMPMGAIRIVDDYDREVPDGQPGEIIVRGPMVFKEYWNLPEDTAYAFRGGWHHTGDLARFDDNGYMWYAGRKEEKDLIKPGGENVYPAEVEKTILQHPAVAKTVVFGVLDQKWGEAVMAVCQLKVGESLEAQELIDFVAQRLARYKKPKSVIFVENFPLLDDGLPDRAKVKEIYCSFS
jgi:long-chain acyl-CoA synthetase